MWGLCYPPGLDFLKSACRRFAQHSENANSDVTFDPSFARILGTIAAGTLANDRNTHILRFSLTAPSEAIHRV